jgi:hypothetical protein
LESRVRRNGRRLFAALGIIAALLAATLFWFWNRSTQPSPLGGRRPLVVIGIDGGEWKVIRRLWAEGKLPHLKAIAERGATATLRTAYNSSPVIWTT